MKSVLVVVTLENKASTVIMVVMLMMMIVSVTNKQLTNCCYCRYSATIITSSLSASQHC